LLLIMSLALALLHSKTHAQELDHHAHHGMSMDDKGMVMGGTSDRLPRGCEAISGDLEFDVHAGHQYARDFPGSMFSYDLRDFRVPACSRVTMRLHNDDAVRHQWMVHGLPRYLYPGGMFHIEAEGGATVAGTLIVPADDATYLVHCDIAQHMEKGMKAQLVVGRGGGELWAIPGTTAALRRDNYLPMSPAWLVLVAAGVGFVAGWWGLRRVQGRRVRRET
jgi:hypothetical protein